MIEMKRVLLTFFLLTMPILRADAAATQYGVDLGQAMREGAAIRSARLDQKLMEERIKSTKRQSESVSLGDEPEVQPIQKSDGNLWRALQEESRYALVSGYNIGVAEGAMSASFYAGAIYNPASNVNRKFDIDSYESKTEWERLTKLMSVVVKNKGLRYGVKEIVDQMDYLYRDPASRVIVWSQMIDIAQEKLDGKDVNQRIASLIRLTKNNPFVDIILEGGSIFKQKK